MLFFRLMIFVLCVSNIAGNEIAKDSANIEKLFMKGVDAYEQQKWSLCVSNFEEVNQLTRLLHNVISNCRIACQSDPFKPFQKDKVEDLQIFEQFLKRTKCLSVCQNRGFKTLQILPKMSMKIAAQIKSLEQYTYLHICYFHRNEIQRAASAAYTYVLQNRQDEDMMRNLEYYLKDPNVDGDNLVNFEAKNYVSLFKRAVDAYNSKMWSESIAAAEETLQDYLISENECRALCEGSFDQRWLPDLVTSVANHFTFSIQCKQNCQKKLRELNFNSGIDFLIEVLNYLQITYYHLEKYKQAARAVESILLLKPDHEDMTSNKKLYLEFVQDNEFKPLPQIISYVERDNYEKYLLKYIQKNFSKDVVDNVLFNY